MIVTSRFYKCTDWICYIYFGSVIIYILCIVVFFVYFVYVPSYFLVACVEVHMGTHE